MVERVVKPSRVFDQLLFLRNRYRELEDKPRKLKDEDDVKVWSTSIGDQMRYIKSKMRYWLEEAKKHQIANNNELITEVYEIVNKG